MGRGLAVGWNLGVGVNRGVALGVVLGVTVVVAVGVALGVVVGVAVAVAVGVGRWRADPRRCLDRNHHRRACLEVADCRIGTLRRLIGVEPEIIQCAPANRVGVLILCKGFCVPRYGISSLSHSPRRAAVTLVVERAVVCPAGLLRRRVKADVTDIDPRARAGTLKD